MNRRQLMDSIAADVDQHVSDAIREHDDIQTEKRASILQREDWHDSTDALIWAEKFVETLRSMKDTPGALRHPELNVGCMVSWFANAIETGRRNPRP